MDTERWAETLAVGGVFLTVILLPLAVYLDWKRNHRDQP